MSSDFTIRKSGSGEGITIEYSGVCDHSVMEKFTEILSGEWAEMLSPKQIKTILFCSNEVIQNIGFYSAERVSDGNQTGVGNFKLNIHPDKALIIASSKTTGQEYSAVEVKVNKLNLLDAEGLKRLYKEKLKSESESTSKGGGIGLLEMRRKTKNLIGLERMDTDNGIYIIFIITIEKGEDNG